MFNILDIFSKQPWKEYEPIHQFVKRNLDETGKINDPYLELPDEPKKKKGEIKWAVGAMDGVLSHHFGGQTEKLEQIESVISLLVKRINHSNKRNRINLYNCLKKIDAISLIDDLMSEMQKINIDLNQLYSEVRWLALNSAHRNVVKFAIAILGRFNTDDDDVLLVLGKHEEFTLYSAVAVINKDQDAEIKLLELAKCVKGWGKIHIVEHLRPKNEETKRWLICYGCENAVMDEYLAYTCAVNGDLLRYLNAPQVDYEIFRGAGRIIQALISGGPASDINDYSDGAEVIQKYVEHSQHIKARLEDLIVLGVTADYLDEKDQEEYEKLLALGWNEITIKESIKKIKRILSDDEWSGLILQELKSDNDYRKYIAIRAANMVRLDIWDNLYSSLMDKPNDARSYLEMMKTEDVNRIIRLCNFAEENLNLTSIIGNPEDIMFGYNKDNDSLDYILQSLDRFEGIGGKLISIGLQAKAIRNRNMAIKALEKWDTSFWPEDTIQRLNVLKEIEPSEDTLQRINQLLNRVNQNH